MVIEMKRFCLFHHLITWLLLLEVFGDDLGEPVLQSPFDLPPPNLFFCNTSEFLFRFDLSTVVSNDMTRFHLTRGEDCNIDIWDNNYLIPHVEYDLAPIDTGTNVRQLALVLDPDISLIGNSPIYAVSEDGGTGSMNFCVKLEITTADGATVVNWREVKYSQTTQLQGGLRKLGTKLDDGLSNLQHHRRLNVDCSLGYDVVFENWWKEGSGVVINPVNITYEEDVDDEEGKFSGVMVGPALAAGVGSWGSFDTNLTYNLEAYECDENNAPTIVSVYEQGDTIRVCIKPDEYATSSGLFMKSIDSMYLSKTGVDLIQYAIDGGQLDFFGFSEFDCSPGSSVCWVDTILRAEFFAAPGLVSISGIGSLQFGSIPRRSLHSEQQRRQRELQNQQGRRERGKFTLQFPVTTFQETFHLKKGNLQAMSQTQAILLVLLAFILIMNCILLCWIRQSRRIHSIAQAERLLKSQKSQRKGVGLEICTEVNKK